MKRLIENNTLKYCFLIVYALAGILLLSCEETSGPVTGITTSAYKLLISPESSAISTNGGSTSVRVKVYAGTDTTDVKTGVTVNFSAIQDQVPSVYINPKTTITDANGYAIARVYGGIKAGIIEVTATINVSASEKYSDRTYVTVVSGGGLVSASELEILADGKSQSIITATVVDSVGQPLPGKAVGFVTTAGTITPQSFTDENGKALAMLRSAPSVQDVSATVTASVADGAGKIAATDIVSEDAAGSAAKSAKIEGALGSVTVLMKGITIIGTLDKDVVFANEADSTFVTVHVKETTSGLPVSGASVDFAATLGTLRSASGITDTAGDVQVVLFGANVAGDATFTGMIAEGVAFTADLILVKEINMQITSNPTTLSSNGQDISTITALLKDVDGNPIQGITVYFTTTDGIILPSAETDEWGQASVSLRSARYNTIATVTAKYGAIEKSTNVQFGGMGLSILATPVVLVADDEDRSQLSITLNDASNAPIVDEVVTLSTNLGTLYNSNGSISGTSVIDSTSTEGKITAYISSDTAGDAIVTVKTTGNEETVTIHFTNYTFSLSPLKSSILAGGETTSIIASLRDIDGEIQSIDTEDITFSTTLGRIGTIAESPDGNIIAQLISGSTAGTATITASIIDPAVSTSVAVVFSAAESDSIFIEADKPTVKLGGNTVSLKATVFDETGNPKSGESVTFSILQGPGGGEVIIPGTATTNERGQAVVLFTTGNRGSERDGVQIQALLGDIESNIIKLTISGEPKSVQVGYADTYEEEEDGTYSLEITAIVSDVNRNSVVDGTIVNFSLVGEAGVITGQVSTLNGVATTSLLYSPSDAGKEVQLTASASGVEDVINIPLPGFKPSSFSTDARPKAIPADGKSKITVSVTLFDQSGSSENVPDGTMVAFTTTGGNISPSVARSVDGVATAILTSDKNPSQITVQIQSGDLENTVMVRFEEVGSIVNEVHAVELSIDDPELRADGIASTMIYAKLLKFDDSIITTPTTVKFETDIGEITSNVLSDPVTGIATAQFSSNVIGTANVTVSVGTVYDIINVFLIPGPPLSIDLDFEPTSVGIQGSGRNETLIITAYVKDNKNNPVADNNFVRFDLVGSFDSEASLSPSSVGNSHISESVPTVNGSAKVAFNAGTVSGTVRIRATIVDENGLDINPEISSETTEFQVFSGPPYLETADLSDPFTESRITLAGGPLNIYAGELNTNESKSSITILIGDKYNNPVPKGTAVFLTTTGGIITTSTGYTGDIPSPPMLPDTDSEVLTKDYEGIAYATLYAGNPFPTRENSMFVPNPNAHLGGPAQFDLSSKLMPMYDFDGNGFYNDGIAIVTAYSQGLDENNNQVIAWNYVPVVLSLGVNTFTIETDKDAIHIGETATLTVRIYDINGNPVVGGSKIDYSSDLGALSPKSIETTSPGTTTYHVSLTNTKDPDLSTPGNTVVTVKLTSPNGNITMISEPIFLDVP